VYKTCAYGYTARSRMQSHCALAMYLSSLDSARECVYYIWNQIEYFQKRARVGILGARVCGHYVRSHVQSRFALAIYLSACGSVRECMCTILDRSEYFEKTCGHPSRLRVQSCCALKICSSLLDSVRECVCQIWDRSEYFGKTRECGHPARSCVRSLLASATPLCPSQ
jgi:hypothetical protein